MSLSSPRHSAPSGCTGPPEKTTEGPLTASCQSGSTEPTGVRLGRFTITAAVPLSSCSRMYSTVWAKLASVRTGSATSRHPGAGGSVAQGAGSAADTSTSCPVSPRGASETTTSSCAPRSQARCDALAGSQRLASLANHYFQPVANRSQHVRAVLRQGGFRRLFGVRLAGQFGDGVFQAALAGAVLFDPQRSANAADIASGFAVLLLPYSLIGPFAGVLLDRWWRQRVLTYANLIRALAVIGIGIELATRSARSAAVRERTGGDLGQPVRAVDAVGRPAARRAHRGARHRERVLDHDRLGRHHDRGRRRDRAARIPSAAATVPTPCSRSPRPCPYLVAAVFAAGFERTLLGPDDVERAKRETIPEVMRGLVDGGRHVVQARPAFYGLVLITVDPLRVRAIDRLHAAAVSQLLP